VNNPAKWIGGLAKWIESDTVYLSVAFTWKIDEAYAHAAWAKNAGFKVKAGGPALFLPSINDILRPVAEVPASNVGISPDAVMNHNPAATIASRGCPVGCYFCIVPKMEGAAFTLLPDFPVRPILCDNNLSALPIEYQKHIVKRYESEQVPLLDANSGFEPMTFSDEVFSIWKPINRGPWRFAYDELKERTEVLRVMKMLSGESSKRKRVYVLIGNEPLEGCMQRIREVIENGCEPHVQPYIKLNALQREPHVQHDWTPQLLSDVARWANRFLWKYTPFETYDRSKRTGPPEYDEQQGLFV